MLSDDIFNKNSTDQRDCHIHLSDSAAEKLRILFSEKKNKKLRITVSAGGCSGFQYDFSIVEAVKRDDLVIATKVGDLLVDIVSARFLNGAELDHNASLAGESFRINFPHVESQCSCGVSFMP